MVDICIVGVDFELRPVAVVIVKELKRNDG